MKNSFTYLAGIILLLTFGITGQTVAQIPANIDSISPPDVIRKAKAALEANFDNLKEHRNFMFAMGYKNPRLATQYKAWMEKYPKKAGIPLGIGTVYFNAEMPEAKAYLLKAAAIEPQNAEIWFMLSGDAGMRGQDDLSTEYMKKASLTDTSNVNYAVSYLMSLRDSAPDYKQKVFDFVKQFPASERGAQALYLLARSDTSLHNKITYFEELRKLYPPQKFNWSSSGMAELADAYMKTNPQKALTLINEMGDNKDLKMRKPVAEALIRINELQQNQNYKEALTELNQIKDSKLDHIDDFITLKKAALLEAAGDAKAAYDTLAIKFAKLPTDELYTALTLYGKKIGKEEVQITKDVKTIRDAAAVPAYPFYLGMYTGKGNLSLKSLKGKVVLLTFWFPGCAPCKEEFPHFEAVLNRFKNKGVTYVGINVYPTQDAYVIPFIKNNKYSFIPLRGSAAFARDGYGVYSEPQNFLIDQDGKIVFKGFRIDNSNHRTLELMISALLKKDS
ncbi:TlpA family protein disulfide reductase [Mucilaginibacter sp. Bleaf8]|uniref:TlpA disulfide reductase family protein n=1 Tax=Mucilaginibacter sp. Bleaf8 TaxID=2834430 RepID=UPI001BD15268|nr:TlpA disulfide reductase family protein [Mucilaginibacter sp. Bleaf8]MBS7565737.1 TlpA family protein disulfide reductase [Mucilaginibacter sp. Bleaf8]